MSDNYEQPVEPMSRVEDILRGDTTVHTMSRVEALLKELIEAGGGGGGSTVVVTPIQQTGTKIANITVNGTGYDIFAPEGSSGSVITIDPEYQSGTLLATLTIDGTEYYIYAPSGGGTTVVANPEGEATDTLEKIQIGNDIYSVEGGGSTTPFTEEDLWVNPDGSGIGTYTLEHSINDYDFLAIYYGLYDEYTSGILVSDYRLVSVDDLKRLHTEGKKLLITGWQNRTIYIDFNQTAMVISVVENGNTVLRVRGIKLPKGSGSGDISGPNSEIIPLGPGTGTTTRTFNLQRTPKKVSIYWYEDYTGEHDKNWGSYYSFIWGQTRAYGLGGGDDVAAQSQLGKVAYISYGQDGKSFSLTGGNEGSACNTSNPKHYGFLYLEYGSGVESPSIGDYTWTQILSGNPATIALPDEYTKLILMAEVGNNVEFCGVIDVAEMKKALQVSGKTLYSYSNSWNDGTGNHDATYLNYDGTNIGIGSTYSGVTAILYGVKVTENGGASEIIDIPAGTDTTSRTFTFNKAPKRITWDYTNNSDGWKAIVTLEYGTSYTTGLASQGGITGNASGMMAQATYSADNKSVTLTGHNAFGAVNVSDITGKMYVEY